MSSWDPNEVTDGLHLGKTKLEHSDVRVVLNEVDSYSILIFFFSFQCFQLF
jgi:hypothetical protein